MTAKTGTKTTVARTGKRRFVWRLIIWILLGLVISPLLLLLFYRLPFVHPVSTLMLRDSVSFSSYQRQWVPLENISPSLVNAVLVAEDGQFCAHSGIDWRALQDVVNSANGPQRGASTIPMQMVKNLFLWQDRSYLRKSMEIPLAFAADTILPKKRIMEIYLNIAEWGPGIYGAEAAAQHYFKRPARSLSPRQGALLAASLPNPDLRNPARPSAKLWQLANIIAARARHSGAYITCLR